MKIIIVVLIGVILAGGYYFVAPSFTTVTIDEAAPVTTVQSSESLSETNVAVPAEEMESPLLPVIDTASYPASGSLQLLTTATGPVLRFTDFETVNGPKVHLYLSKDLAGTDYVDLGPIKATSGNINYPVPDGIDLDQYTYVMHWCVTFNELFNYVELPTS